MSVLEFYPALALVAILGGFWGWAWRQRRRLLRAVTEAAARLEGRYEPGGAHSGGTLFVKRGGRDIVFSFYLSHSQRSESTSVATTLARPTAKELLLKGPDAVSRVPRLAPVDGRLFPVTIQAKSNLLTVSLYGVVRRADLLVELADVVAALAAELETP